MKMNIEIELDWIEEDATLSETIKDEIICSVKNSIKAEAFTDIKSKASKELNIVMSNAVDKLKANIDDKVSSMVSSWVEKEVTITDKWGENPKQILILDIIRQKFDNAMTENVDERGNPTNYGGISRMNYVIGNYVEKHVKEEIGSLSTSIDNKIKEAIDKNLKDQIGSKFAELVLTSAKK